MEEGSVLSADDGGSVNIFGRDAETGTPVSEEISSVAAADRLIAREVPQETVPQRKDDLGLVSMRDDPREVGWVVVVGAFDPVKGELVEALRPLADRRGGPTSWGPLEYPLGADSNAWIDEQINTRDPVPAYVLLAGSPFHLPFELQSALSCISSVGRLDFSTITGAVETQNSERFIEYVAKVGRIEDGETEPIDRAAVFWAPSHGGKDPTIYSCRLLAAPLAERVEKRSFEVTRLFKADATCLSLVNAGSEGRPALIFTASHGTAAKMALGLEAQSVRNGFPVDQDLTSLGLGDLDDSTPFVEGGLVFQFACFGYGTPKSSGYTHWWPAIDAYYAPREVVSAWPKALLGHPRGPLGYVGHTDYAVLHSFADAKSPWASPTDGSGPRMAGFRTGLDAALSGWRCGSVLEGMGRQLGLLNQQLVTVWDHARADLRTPSTDADLVDKFIRRNDARYYFLLGDPAAKPNIKAAG